MGKRTDVRKQTTNLWQDVGQGENTWQVRQL